MTTLSYDMKKEIRERAAKLQAAIELYRVATPMDEEEERLFVEWCHALAELQRNLTRPSQNVWV